MITAVAHPNIALIKYWGKSDEELIIPSTSSISVTLDAYKTQTSIELLDDARTDSGTLNGIAIEGEELSRISGFLQHIRNISGRSEFARIVSVNTVPTAAGLASSASGFAALAVAATQAYGLKLSQRELSQIARRGSGSAARSLFGGMAIWNAGTDDRTSFAEQLQWHGEELEVIVGVINANRKHTSSREAMRNTALTSPYYSSWVTSNSDLVLEALEAIKSGDLDRLGKLTELSTMRMHAVMMAANPPVRYLEPESLQLFDAVLDLRNLGKKIFATADAGPNVKMLCSAEDAEYTLHLLQEEFPNFSFLKSKVGGPPRVL
ncbi:MAG TPA: diphosphomevalonate decarboxylase [Microbacteriaceae bacterium]|nr:diphosphomevalonate decarboxylase [Microbacteriaceae bacterium]